MDSFRRATHWTKNGDGRFEGAIDETWCHMGRAFGGVLGGAILRSLSQDTDRHPLLVSIHFCARVGPGSVRLDTHAEHHGKRLAHSTARVWQDERLACLATATFTADLRGQDNPIEPARLGLVAADLGTIAGGQPPAFMQYFDSEYCLGALPFSQSTDAYLGGTIRLRDGDALDPALALAYLDAWPPAVFATYRAPRPVATVELVVHFFEPLPLPDAVSGDTCWVKIRSEWAGPDFVSDVRDLFDSRGRHLARCRQLLAHLTPAPPSSPSS